MCGIVAYLGKKVAQPILIEGLKRLEYRGYDSAGVALLGSGAIRIKKTSGRISALEAILDEPNTAETFGIGHTRWATHGEPNAVNAHPHPDYTGKIAVVHNGIIENYGTLKTWLQNEGAEFASETDTEVIANLIGYFYAKEDEGNRVSSIEHRASVRTNLNKPSSGPLASCTALTGWRLSAQIFPICSSARKRAAP